MIRKFTMMLAVMVMMFIFAVPVIAGNPYISLKGSLGTTDMGDVKFSHIPEGLVNATDSGSTETVKSPGIAIGYDTGDLRFEFEYFNRGQVEHDTSLAILNGGVTIDGTYVSFDDLLWGLPGAVNPWIADMININSKVDTETFFLNVYADFPVAKKLELYAGAGVGMAKHNSKVNYTLDTRPLFGPGAPVISMSDRDSNTCAAFNVTVGAAYLITDNIAIDLGLRYADLGEAELGSFLEADKIISKEAIFALRYTF